MKDLTKAFPDKVTAILGIHKFELLCDRDARITPGEKYRAHCYVTVYPNPYHNYTHDPTQQNTVAAEAKVEAEPELAAACALDSYDKFVLDLLYEAGMEVYTSGAHYAMRFLPALPDHTTTHE